MYMYMKLLATSDFGYVELELEDAPAPGLAGDGIDLISLPYVGRHCCRARGTHSVNVGLDRDSKFKELIIIFM